MLELLQQQITSIAAGRNNSAAVVQHNDLYTWGEGLCGKLGLGSGASSMPSRVSNLTGLHLPCVCSTEQFQLWAVGAVHDTRVWNAYLFSSRRQFWVVGGSKAHAPGVSTSVV